MASQNYNAFLVFTAGPVQGFVGQARRTRDLWAGSWLLSYLAESALVAAEELGGTAIVPYREKPGELVSERSKIGGIPNRFEVGFDDPATAAEAGRSAVAGFRRAWLSLCERVWDKYLASATAKFGNGTREIWERQTHNFWELSWVVAQDKEKAGHLAAGRKAFRNSPFKVEGGYKCSLMGTHQELSGHTRKEDQKKFWDAVRADSGASLLDLGKNEQLCAISLVKRLYPKVHEGLRDSDTVSWPSTSFIAALPWLKSLSGEYQEAAQRYVDLAKGLQIEQNERSSAKEFAVPWASIDAQAWFKGGLERNEWILQKNDLKSLTDSFRSLRDKHNNKPLPIWALLVMDGDSLGTLLSTLQDKAVLSRCLESFSQQVGKTVGRYNGKTIYAGGDDVLAMLPAESAVEAAAALSQVYKDCFSKTEAKTQATISAAIVFAPLHHPFQSLVKQGHELLDRVAKDRSGRDSLAIDIVLGSGLSARWAAPWSVVLGDYADTPGLLQVLGRFRNAEDRTDAKGPTYNASFLYNLRSQFLRLFPDLSGQPGEFGEHTLNDDDSNVLTDIANAEYRRRLSKTARRERPAEQTRKEIEQLMWLSRRYTRRCSGGQARIVCDDHVFSFDGWRVARFLQQVKEGDLGEH